MEKNKNDVRGACKPTDVYIYRGYANGYRAIENVPKEHLEADLYYWEQRGFPDQIQAVECRVELERRKLLESSKNKTKLQS